MNRKKVTMTFEVDVARLRFGLEEELKAIVQSVEYEDGNNVLCTEIEDI